MNHFFALVMLVALATSVDTAAQTSDPEEADDRLVRLESDVEKLMSLHVSGYIQADWQHFDQTTSAGGRALYFDRRRNLFTIRRGRIKLRHRFSTMMSATVHTDISERGVRMKKAYVHINLSENEGGSEASLTVGAFNRPNYEIDYSSTNRESAERAMVTRAFYSDQPDLGVMLTLGRALSDRFDPRVQIGLFNGSGLEGETDAHKDLIARLTLPLPLDPKGAIRVRLGATAYYGGIPQLTDSVLVSKSGVTSLVANDALGSAVPGMGNRRNVNVEGQVTLDLLPLGHTVLRGEYMVGRRPTAAVAAVPPDTTRFFAGSAGTPFQVRKQSGYYLYIVQRIGKRWEVACKDDWFDRNTDLKGSEVTSVADAAANVLGFGFSCFVDNVRLTFWYEIPSFANDENIAHADAGLAEGLRSVDLKDNKTTVRLQYKF